MTYLRCLLLLVFVFGCDGKDLLKEMQAVVPVYKSGKMIMTRNLPDQKMSIMQYEVNATEATENGVIDFYKDTFAKKGWKLEEIKSYAGDGCVFSFISDRLETVTIQTITKGMKDHGKLKVVINMSRRNS